MQKIRQIRQGLVDVRNIVIWERNVSQEQFQILEELSNHYNYGIRRQAHNLLFIVSKNHQQNILSGS
jgi:hypothetical protein